MHLYQFRAFYIRHDNKPFLTFLYFVLLLVVFTVCVSGRKCNSLKTEQKIVLKLVNESCIEKYQARCGWFSVDYCTFERQKMCSRMANVSVTQEYIASECCKGWVLGPDAICITLQEAKEINFVPGKKEPPKEIEYNVMHEEVEGVNNSTDVPMAPPIVAKHTADDEDTEGLSHGVYAGLGCALLFLITVLIFTVLAVRKRKRRRPKRKTQQHLDDIQDIAQRMALYNASADQLKSQC